MSSEFTVVLGDKLPQSMMLPSNIFCCSWTKDHENVGLFQIIVFNLKNVQTSL